MKKYTEEEKRLQIILGFLISKEKYEGEEKKYISLERKMIMKMKEVGEINLDLHLKLENIFEEYKEEVKKEYFNLGIKAAVFSEFANKEYLETLIEIAR